MADQILLGTLVYCYHRNPGLLPESFKAAKDTAFVNSQKDYRESIDELDEAIKDFPLTQENVAAIETTLLAHDDWGSDVVEQMLHASKQEINDKNVKNWSTGHLNRIITDVLEKRIMTAIRGGISPNPQIQVFAELGLDANRSIEVLSRMPEWQRHLMNISALDREKFATIRTILVKFQQPFPEEDTNHSLLTDLQTCLENAE